MEKILFKYPYFIFNDEDPEESYIIQREASIRPLNLLREPYDVILNDGDNCFHMIFGTQINGHFLCVPNYFIGCELASYDDIQWNEMSLSEAADHYGQLNYNDISAICYALKSLQSYLC